jgi:tetratricopeptide (TPR) repeat protein
MSVKVANNRFILSSLHAGFYQQMFRGISGFQELGCKLVREAEVAHVFRELSRLEEIASMLCNLPIKEFRLIGQYYKGLHARRLGQNVGGVFEKVAEKSRTYKARALMSLAAVEGRKGNYDGELDYFTEALKTADSPSLIVEVSRCIAVVKAKEGFHPQSLKDLEKIAPMLRYASPFVRCQYFNSSAVELAEVGRIEEARNISNIVLASSYAFAYPEWRETGDEVDVKAYRLSRSAVSFAQKPVQQNVLYLPERERQEYSPSPFQPKGIVVKLNTWKSKMVKEPNGEDELDFSKMSDKDKLFKIIELSSNEDITDDQLDQILDAVIRITSKRT